MAQVATTLTRWVITPVAALAFYISAAQAGPLDEMSLDRWAKLREAERYQLNVAEKLYREKQYKVAADEYEKFLKLYEKSEGAPFAQLKWSHCQVELRKQNTAIKDGYQSVIDYFPDSPEAPVAALLIGRTFRGMGDMKMAKKAFSKSITTYPKHFTGVMARLDLVDIAAKENDLPTQTAMLRELAFDVERKGPTVEPCVTAARQYARLTFQAGNFEEGMRAFVTTCGEEEIPSHLLHINLGHLPQILYALTTSTDEPTKKLGEKLADAAAGYLKVYATTRLADEKRKPKGIEAMYAMAEVRRSANQPDKQKLVLDEMVKTLGTDDEILGHLAQWHKANKQRDQARAIYAKFKDPAEGQRQIAVSFEEEKQFDKAVEIYRKLALSDPKAAARWMSAAASAYRQPPTAKPDQALAIYRDLLASDAKNAAEYHFQIAETLYYAGRWKECIAAYRGTDRFPHNYQHMAAANRNLKQYDEAIALYSQIIAAAPASASWAQHQIAITHEQAGRKEEAIKAFKTVCDRYPKSSEGSQAHAHLNEKYKITVTLGGAKD